MSLWTVLMAAVKVGLPAAQWDNPVSIPILTPWEYLPQFPLWLMHQQWRCFHPCGAAGIKPNQSFQAGSTHQDGQPWPASDAPTATPGHASSEQPRLNGTLPKSRNFILVSTSNPSWDMKKWPSPTSLWVTSVLLVPFRVPNWWVTRVTGATQHLSVVFLSQGRGSLVLFLTLHREFPYCLQFPGEKRCPSIMGIVCSYNKKEWITNNLCLKQKLFVADLRWPASCL